MPEEIYLHHPPAPGNFAPNSVSYATVSEFLAALKSVPGGVQVVIDETYSANPATYTYTDFQKAFGLNASIAADVAAFPFLSTSSVFRYDGLLGQDQAWDWYESSIPQADALLSDMSQTIAQHTPILPLRESIMHEFGCVISHCLNLYNTLPLYVPWERKLHPSSLMKSNRIQRRVKHRTPRL